MKELRLSIVIPAYNEEKRLPKTLKLVGDYLSSMKYPCELVVVDGGSRDDTSAVVHEQMDKYPFLRLVRLPRNHGKGYHVRTGIQNSLGKFIIFSDADCSTPITEVEKILPLLEGEYDVVIGSRRMADSKLVKPQGILRRALGKSYNSLVKAIGIRGFEDISCGFKGFKKEAAHRIFRKTRMDGFSIDAELLYLAQGKLGYKVKEIPVEWKDAAGSKVSKLKDPILMGMDLLKIKLNDILGRYG
jgi:dolichyl-phosphate beta-glucosyltransferase